LAAARQLFIVPNSKQIPPDVTVVPSGYVVVMLPSEYSVLLVPSAYVVVILVMHQWERKIALSLALRK
jgi:hypothetical protein